MDEATGLNWQNIGNRDACKVCPNQEACKRSAQSIRDRAIISDCGKQDPIAYYEQVLKGQVHRSTALAM